VFNREDSDKNGYRNIHMALYFLGAVLSGAGGNYLWMRNVAPEVVAPDRFTGTQGSALISRMEHLETEIRGHQNNHPDKQNQFDRRITTLEAQYAVILRNQERILDRLDGR
jgi:hypothetical protein